MKTSAMDFSTLSQVVEVAAVLLATTSYY